MDLSIAVKPDRREMTLGESSREAKRYACPPPSVVVVVVVHTMMVVVCH
jgi:hypothetical protein